MVAELRETAQPYHVPPQSKLALATSLGLILGVVGAGSMMNTMTFGKVAASRGSLIFGLGVLCFVASLFVWLRAIIVEHRRGRTGVQVRRSFAMGRKRLIDSEVMCCRAFFG